MLQTNVPFVYVLAPEVITFDATIDYYYDFSQSIKEFTAAFQVLELEWKWHPVRMDNYREVIDTISIDALHRKVVVFNLCDGDEINGTPGVSVIHYLAEKRLPFTGSDSFFYIATTSKIVMKEAFDRAGISHAPWFAVQSPAPVLNGEFHNLPKPVIVKPAISAGSIGLGVRNVVHTETELTALIRELYKGYHGWDLAAGGFVAERFIKGREFTSFLVGDGREAFVYPPVERVFHPDLPELEQFLSFDRLWEFYEGEQPVGKNEDFYTYSPVPEIISKDICQLSLDAYAAVGGKGYGRIDLRQDAESGQLYVLEVNAQCGLSEDENYTSIGAILRFSNEPFHRVIGRIIENALRQERRPKHEKQKQSESGE